MKWKRTVFCKMMMNGNIYIFWVSLAFQTRVMLSKWMKCYLSLFCYVQKTCYSIWIMYTHVQCLGTTTQVVFSRVSLIMKHKYRRYVQGRIQGKVFRGDMYGPKGTIFCGSIFQFFPIFLEFWGGELYPSSSRGSAPGYIAQLNTTFLDKMTIKLEKMLKGTILFGRYILVAPVVER